MIFKQPLLKLHWFMASQLGFDPRRLVRSLGALPRYARDWRQFRHGHAGRMALAPCLSDRNEEGGATKSEYFWQDLLVARWIHAARPERHVDVGSRVDGFVAHVASFREIEVFDVRAITSSVPGVVFRQADLMDPHALGADIGAGYCDSLSCLHAIEHFGLGRYGDPIDPRGYQRGIANLARLLRAGGTFYLSTPLGRERVEFNANWVFDPRTIIACAAAQQLTLVRLTAISATTAPRVLSPTDAELDALAAAPYTLGVFEFKKRDREIG